MKPLVWAASRSTYRPDRQCGGGSRVAGQQARGDLAKSETFKHQLLGQGCPLYDRPGVEPMTFAVDILHPYLVIHQV